MASYVIFNVRYGKGDGVETYSVRMDFQRPLSIRLADFGFSRSKGDSQQFIWILFWFFCRHGFAKVCEAVGKTSDLWWKATKISTLVIHALKDGMTVRDFQPKPDGSTIS